MGRKKKHYKKRKYSYKKNKDEGKEYALLALFIGLVFVLLWIGFWIGVISAVIGIIFITHKINDFFKLYTTKYYYGAILTFLISFLIILFGGTQIAHNMGKINNTFWGWAVESSNYLKLNNSKGKTTIEPNIEGMMQQSAIDSLTSTGNNLK